MKGTILLVEDDLDARASLARALTREDYACLQAGSVEEARAAFSGGIFAAAIVDIILGQDTRGGLSLVPELRALPSRPPVIVVTAFADVERVKAALNGGASYLLEKPFRAADLLEALGRVVVDAGAVLHRVERMLSLATLTRKETAVARLLLKGLTSQEIARLESNSDRTIRQHIVQIYAKCGVSSRAEFFHYVFPS